MLVFVGFHLILWSITLKSLRDICVIFFFTGIRDRSGDFIIHPGGENLLQVDLKNIIKVRHLYIISSEVFFKLWFCWVDFCYNSFSSSVIVLDSQGLGLKETGQALIVYCHFVTISKKGEKIILGTHSREDS